MDVTTLAVGSTGHAAGDEIVVGGGAVAFDVPESDQGERDLDGDQAADGNVVHIARARK
jgi:hypothetical protein